MQGTALNQQRKFEQALSILQTGFDYISNDADLQAECQGQMGEAEFGLNHTKEGISAYEKALKLSAKNTFVKNNYAYQLAFHELDLEKAIQIIDQALNELPNEGRYLDTKGLILFQQGKYPEAKSYFERACGAKASTDKTCVEHLGDVQFKLGKVEEAIVYWLRAKELGSANKILNEKITQKKYAKPVY